MKPLSPTSKASEQNRQTNSVSPLPSLHVRVRGAVELGFCTAHAGKLLPLLALLLSLTLPSLVQAQFEYAIDNGAVTITEYTGRGGEVTIPDTIEGLPVTGIGPYAFYGNSDLISVSIPSTVTSIGEEAFSGCARLSNLNLPTDLIAIGERAYFRCTSLITLIIPDRVVTIGESAFRGCTCLLSVKIPASVTSLGERVFAACTDLTAIDVDASNPAYSSLDGVIFNKNQTLLIYCPTGKAGSYIVPDSVAGIAAEAFYDCANLSSVIIGNSVASIPIRGFHGCSSLTNLVIPDGVTSIEGEAFSDCTSLASVTIPATATSIGISAFSGCTSLINVIMTDGLTSVGQGAFARCTSLVSVTIPASVKDLEEGALAACTSLRAIDVHASNPAYSSTEGVLLDKARTMVLRCPMAKVGSFAIPDSVTNIAAWAFDGCANLSGIIIGNSVSTIEEGAFAGCVTLNRLAIPDNVVSIGGGVCSGCTAMISVTIGNGVTHIPGGAFRDCTSLSDVTIPNAVTNIGVSAFSGCTSLVNLLIPDSVTSIEDRAFFGCIRLASITIPASVTALEASVFQGCSSLNAIEVDSWNPAYRSLEGVLFNHDQTTLTRYPGGKAGSYTVPDRVTSIGDWAFDGCTRLTTIVISTSVTSLGDRAFGGCTGLASVTVPASVTTIGEWAFSSCTNLASVVIPSNVTSIGAWAFYGCDSLEGVTIPAGVGSIGSSAFYGCARLTAIMVDEDNMSYSSLDGALFNKSQTTLIQCPGGKAGNFTIPASVTSIDYRAFRDGAGLTSITVEAGNTMFSSLDGVLFDKNRMSLLRCPEGRTGRYTIPNTVTQIGELAFAACAGLTGVTIPASVTAIGMQAFAGCTSLTEIYFLGDAPFPHRPFYTGVVPTIYYLPSTTGWREQYDGRPTVLWDPRIETSDGSFGVQSDQFGFNITANSDLTVVVEASASLTDPTWAPVGTNTLAGGSSYFSDPQWTNHPVRCYRLRSP